MCSAEREKATYVKLPLDIIDETGGILSGLSLPRMVTSERDIVTEAKMETPAR